MKLLLLLLLTLPLAATAQKLEATAPPITYHVGNEKAPLYRAVADTAGKAESFLPPGTDVTVVGEFSPRWAVVKRTGFLYLTPIQKLKNYSSATVPSASDKRFNELMAESYKISAIRKAGLKMLDDKNGFRTYRFGESPAAYPDLRQQSSKGRKLQYIDPAENLHIGEAELESIIYFFYKGKLSSVMLQTDGLINSTRVKEALETQYGQPIKSTNSLSTYYWEGQTVSLTYDENSISRDATIIFRNRALQAQEEADDKEVAKKAASDL